MAVKRAEKDQHVPEKIIVDGLSGFR